MSDIFAMWAAIDDRAQRKVITMGEGQREIYDTDNHFGRPVIGKIVVFSQEIMEQFTYDKPWACISIIGADLFENERFARIDPENRVGLLRLGFDDIEFPRHYRTPISERQAAEILTFTENVWDKIDLLAIHCYAGISRSSATAKALSEIYQPDLAHYFDELYSPNPLVLRTIREARE